MRQVTTILYKNPARVYDKGHNLQKMSEGVTVMNIPVFVSYSAPYNKEQTDFIEAVENFLRKRLCFEPRTLGKTDYNANAPLTACRQLMMESNGLMTIAFRRCLIEKGWEKPNNPQGKDISGQYFSSPWCHIETAMAFQLGLPILIFREKGVIAEGVLESGVVGLYMPEFDLSKSRPNEYLESQQWIDIVNQWGGYVRAVREAKGRPARLY